jgi:hypothetical protein
MTRDNDRIVDRTGARATRRAFLPLAIPVAVLVAFVATTWLTGFWRTASYRYKLTLTVDTPDGVKSAFNVVDVSFFYKNLIVLNLRGTSVTITGGALYLDLGPGKRPLIALLTKDDVRSTTIRWDLDQPTSLLTRLTGGNANRENEFVITARFHRMPGPYEIQADALPDLVTFADIADPKTVLAVDPHNLSGALENDVRWKRITIEVTNARVTGEIENRLPWLKGMTTNLSGKTISNLIDLSDRLYAWNFKKD